MGISQIDEGCSKVGYWGKICVSEGGGNGRVEKNT